MLNNMYNIISSEDPYWQSFMTFFKSMHETSSALKFIQYRRSALEIANQLDRGCKLPLDEFHDYCIKHGFKYHHNALTSFNIEKLKWLNCFRINDISEGDNLTPDELILIINLITEHAKYYKDKIKTLEHGK